MQKRISICCLAVLFTMCFSPIDKSYAMLIIGDRLEGASVTAAREGDLRALSLYELYKAKAEVEEFKRVRAYFAAEGWQDYMAKGDAGSNKRKYAWFAVPETSSEPFRVVYGELFGKMSNVFFRGGTLGMQVSSGAARDTETQWLEIRHWAVAQELDVEDSTKRIRCRNCSKEKVSRIYDDLKKRGWGDVICVEYFAKPFRTAGVNAMAAVRWDLDKMGQVIKAEIANREDRRMREAEAIDE